MQTTDETIELEDLNDALRDTAKEFISSALVDETAHKNLELGDSNYSSE